MPLQSQHFGNEMQNDTAEQSNCNRGMAGIAFAGLNDP